MQKVPRIVITEVVKCIHVNKAKELLVKTNSSISDIAFEYGYENLPYFSYLFKKYTGMNPSTFRQKYTYIYS
jgi:YesN/AraC family two-component response regulator